jgi:hypothetical protein
MHSPKKLRRLRKKRSEQPSSAKDSILKGRRKMSDFQKYKAGRMQKNPELDIILTPGPVRFLGIPVGKVRNENEFWNNVIAKIEKIYNIWKARDLSLLGRVHIIKSLGMSTVMFASNMMNIGEKIMQQIEKLNYSFLWHGTNNLMKKEICTLPRLMGGLGMFDLSIAVKSQRVRWVRRILQNNKNESWKIMPLSCFKCLDIRFGTELFALRVNDSKNLLNQADIPMFYKQCLLDFQELRRKAESVTQRQVIWCNNRIKFNGEPLAFSHWAKCGILYLDEIFEDGRIDDQKIQRKLVNCASFMFDIAKLKAAVANFATANTNVNESNDLINSILHATFKVTSDNEQILMELTNKQVYTMFLLNKGIEVKSKMYWKRKFNDENIDFEGWFMCNFNSNIIPRKCLDITGRYFHGRINTESRLEKMKLSNGVCTICKEQVENLEHLLYICSDMNYIIWRQIEILMSKFTDIDFKLNEQIILTSVLERQSFKFEIVNMILSVTRYVIWKRRNRIKFESDNIDKVKCVKWIIKEVKGHAQSLQRVKNLMKHDEKMVLLEKLIDILR